jgi:hypothetical protein
MKVRIDNDFLLDYGNGEQSKIPYVTEKDIMDYIDKTGIGPCGPVAEVLRDLGYGEIETGYFGPRDDIFESIPHYWIRTKSGAILDLTNQGASNPKYTYWDIHQLKHNEKCDFIVWGKSDYNFWKERIKFL